MADGGNELVERHDYLAKNNIVRQERKAMFRIG